MDEVIKSYKSGHKVVKAHPRHIAYLAANMREADIKEISYLNGTKPQEAFERALQYDDYTFTVLAPNNIPYAMFGSGKIDEESYIWLLATTDVEKYKFEFLKRCREWVWALAGIYEKVFNYVHCDNELALKWLTWCGATYSEAFEVNGQAFYKFTIEKR